MALHNYHSGNEVFPYGAHDLGPYMTNVIGHSWWPRIFPFLEEDLDAQTVRLRPELDRRRPS